MIYGLGEYRDNLANAFNKDQLNFYTVDELKACFLGVNEGNAYNVPTLQSFELRLPKFAIGYKDSLEKYLGPNKSLSSVSNGDIDHVNTRLRRSGKFGVRCAAKNKNRIHFNLEGIDLDAVVEKNYEGHDAEPTNSRLKQRSITGAELRFIFRN